MKYYLFFLFYSFDDNDDSNLYIIRNIISIEDVVLGNNNDFEPDGSLIVEVNNLNVKELSTEFSPIDQFLGLQWPQLITEGNLSLLKNLVNYSFILLNAYQRCTYSIFTTYNE